LFVINIKPGAIAAIPAPYAQSPFLAYEKARLTCLGSHLSVADCEASLVDRSSRVCVNDLESRISLKIGHEAGVNEHTG